MGKRNISTKNNKQQDFDIEDSNNNNNFNTIQQSETISNNKPILEYNNKTYRSYVGQGLSAPDNLDYQEKNFLNLVDPTRKEIDRTVTKIVRLKAPDYSDKKKKRKEFLLYYENWFGVDWQGKKVAPVTDHIEGLYYEQELEPIIEKNRVVGQQRSGEHPVYYIPFSKETVDKIIEDSNSSDIESIIFVVKDGANRNDSFSYEQFVNYSFDDCCRLMNMKGGPRLNSNLKLLEVQKQEEQEAHKRLSSS